MTNQVQKFSIWNQMEFIFLLNKYKKIRKNMELDPLLL